MNSSDVRDGAAALLASVHRDEAGVSQTVAVLVRGEEVVREHGGLLGAERRRGVEEHPVFAREPVEPVVELFARRPKARGRLRLYRRCTETEYGRGAETREK